MPVAVVFYLTLKVFFVGDTLLVALNWLLLRHRPEQQLGLHPSILHPRAGYIHVRPRNVRGKKGRGGESVLKHCKNNIIWTIYPRARLPVRVLERSATTAQHAQQREREDATK